MLLTVVGSLRSSSSLVASPHAPHTRAGVVPPFDVAHASSVHDSGKISGYDSGKNLGRKIWSKTVIVVPAKVLILKALVFLHDSPLSPPSRRSSSSPQIPLYYIQRSRITVELDMSNGKMNMLRLEGTKTNPIFSNQIFKFSLFNI